jgi:hypothetical protein
LTGEWTVTSGMEPSATAGGAGRLHLSPHRAVKDYLYHMLGSVEGLKALILDGDNAGG